MIEQLLLKNIRFLINTDHLNSFVLLFIIIQKKIPEQLPRHKNGFFSSFNYILEIIIKNIMWTKLI